VRERERERENATMKWRMNSDEVYMARLKIGRKKMQCSEKRTRVKCRERERG
jgi:hypothetical protein